jgi:c-di-GMP-binding flagellar brake protein YcgR
MDIRYGPLGELRAILDDISRGGLAMTVADPLVLYEELEVTVPDTAGDQLLILRARVVHQRAVEHDGEMVYRVGLEFANLRIETRRCLNDLLKTVLESIDGVTDQVE